MKKYIFYIPFFLCFLIIVSCKKEEISSSPQTNATKKQTFSVRKESNWGLHRTYYVGPGACSSPASDCWDDVPIKAPPYVVIKDVADGDEADVAAYFNSEDWKDVFPDLDTDEGENAQNITYLEALQSGEYEMSYGEDTYSNMAYFYCGKADETPISKENFEFVFAVDISDL
jgi:hypothetical protein